MPSAWSTSSCRPHAAQAQAVETVRQLIWWFYRDLKAWKTDPSPRRAAALRARFDRIFRRRTGFVMLDRLLARLHRRKAELLRVLDRPEIPLHTNGSENDIRAHVTKRKISGGTRSEAGRDRPRRDARPDEDLRQARRVVLRLSRRPPRREPEQLTVPPLAPGSAWPQPDPPGNLPRLP